MGEPAAEDRDEGDLLDEHEVHEVHDDSPWRRGFDGWSTEADVGVEHPGGDRVDDRRTGTDHDGAHRAGRDHDGADRAGANRVADRLGTDHDGADRAGSDRRGTDRHGTDRDGADDDGTVGGARGSGDAERWSRDHVEQVPELGVTDRAGGHVAAAAEQPSDLVAIEVASRAPSSTIGEQVAGAFVVVALVLGAVVAGLALRPTGGDDADVSAAVVAVAAEPRWVVEFDAAVDDVGLGADTVAVSVAGEVIALDAETGDERWRRPPAVPDVAVDRIAVIDGHVLVQQRERGRSELRAYVETTGEPTWNTVGSDGVVTITGDDGDVLVFRRIQVQGDATLEVVDPATGAAAADPMVLSGVTAAGDDLAVRSSSRRTAIWSRDERAIVAGPVDEFNLRMATAVDGAVLALDREGRVVLFDDEGRRADELPLVGEAFEEFGNRPALVGAVDGIGVVASGITVGVDVGDGTIEPLWQRDGRAGPPVMTAAGPVAVLVGPEPSGQIRETLIDPLDGSTIAVTDLDGKRERSPVLGHDAYVLAPVIGAPTRVLSAYRYDGDQLWSAELAPRTTYELAHGMLVTVDSDVDGSVVGLAR